MGLRRELRNPWLVAPILAVILAILSTAVAAAVDCPERVFYRIGDKSATIGWRLPVNESTIEDFGGYRLWMREVWKDEEFFLVREYKYGEDNPAAAGYWHFPEWYQEDLVPVEVDTGTLWLQGVRRDSGDIFQNAFPYEFSVTAFAASDPEALDLECREANSTGVIYPRVGVQNDLDSVRCIPNPYRASADWEYGGQRRVSFIGLPGKALIRIYTVSASLVRTLVHNDPESDLEDWDLKNADGEEVAPGVYLYFVEAEGIGSTEGRIMIIK
jgi:hypothetical protein